MAPASDCTKVGSVQDLTSPKSILSNTKGDPPAYGVHPQDTLLPTSTSGEVNPLTELKCNPINFLYIDGNYDSAKAKYVIDPSLHIPEAYLPPLKDINVDGSGERMNVYLHTGDDLEVDLWILGRKELDSALNPMRRTRMHVGSRNGSLIVKVNAIDNIHPFSLELVSQDKPITVFIPRSFHGTVTLFTRGMCAISISDEILSNCALLTAVGEKKTYFIGDFSPVVSRSGTGLAEWAPDELRAETGGKVVTVKYVDEVKPAVSKRRFFGWLFHTHSRN